MKKQQTKKMGWLRITIITGLIAILQISFTQAQERPPAPTDSLELPTVPLERIPVVSSKTELKIIRLNESLISSGQIEREKTRNDSILAVIDSLLSMEKGIDFGSLSNRYLRNKKNFWSGYQASMEG